MGEDVNNYEEIIFDDDELEEAEELGNFYSSQDGNGYESSSSDEFLEIPINDVTICKRNFENLGHLSRSCERFLTKLSANNPIKCESS